MERNSSQTDTSLAQSLSGMTLNPANSCPFFREFRQEKRASPGTANGSHTFRIPTAVCGAVGLMVASVCNLRALLFQLSCPDGHQMESTSLAPTNNLDDPRGFF